MKKIAFITGSSRGIGRAVAVRLAEEGYAVGINCLHSKALAEQLAEQLRAQGREAAAFQADVADRTAITAALSANYKAGDTATLTLLRGSDRLELSITFDEKNEQTEAANQFPQDQSSQSQGGNYSGWPFGGFFW